MLDRAEWLSAWCPGPVAWPPGEKRRREEDQGAQAHSALRRLLGWSRLWGPTRENPAVAPALPKGLCLNRERGLRVEPDTCLFPRGGGSTFLWVFGNFAAFE